MATTPRRRSRPERPRLLLVTSRISAIVCADKMLDKQPSVQSMNSSVLRMQNVIPFASTYVMLFVDMSFHFENLSVQAFDVTLNVLLVSIIGGESGGGSGRLVGSGCGVVDEVSFSVASRK